MNRVYLVVIVLCLLVLTVTGVVNYRVNYRQSVTIDTVMNDVRGLSGDVSRGHYAAYAGGCIACHTHDVAGAATLGGGVPIDTPFGSFFSPNITSDDTAGIGTWSTRDFVRAMVVGISPDGSHYYPTFPYTSYTVMSAQDLVDLKAWLDTVAPVPVKAPKHEVKWPLSIRGTLVFWKALFADFSRTTEFSTRGQYLVEGPGHCAECHSPRHALGGLLSRSLTGNPNGPDGQPVPAITATALSGWTVEDLELFLEVGMLIDGDFTGGHMAAVIEYGTGLLTASDRREIAQYLLSGDNN